VKQENIPLADVNFDPLIACVRELTGHFGFTTRQSEFDMLARDENGKLPFHQAGAALEVAGLDFEKVESRRLPRQADQYPALVRLSSGVPIIVYELNDDQALIWRPGTAAAVWESMAVLTAEPPLNFLTVWGDPDVLRDQSAPWHATAKYHWFWGELRKERPALQPVLLASLIINLLSIALPLFTMNVYDRVIPNHATASLWVLAIGVLLAFSLEFALRRARTDVLDEVGRRLDLKLSQKIFARMDSVGQQRMGQLHGGRRDKLEISPNLWAGVGLVRGGAGTALVGDAQTVATRIREYQDVGIDTFILSGYPHLEEAYRFAELVFPLLKLRSANVTPLRANTGPFGETIAGEHRPLQKASQS